MSDAWRFLYDEMLAGLGRWLRIASYNTAIAECLAVLDNSKK